MLRTSAFQWMAGVCLMGGVSSAVAPAQTASNYVAITPCRVVDTRAGSGAPAAGATLVADVAATFAIAGHCGLPTSGVISYAMNVTALPKGPLIFMTVYPSGQLSVSTVTSTLNSLSGAVVANAAIVPAGTSGSVDVYATATSDVILDVNGYFTAAFSPSNSSTNNSTALGTGASNAGSDNTGIGFNALLGNTGNINTALGSNALAGANSGEYNVAIGTAALLVNSTGASNTALGALALTANTTGGQNVAVGTSALGANTTGSNDTAVGNGALSMLLNGTGNIGIGQDAGLNLATGDSNIYIGSVGPGAAGSTETNVIRIGNAQTNTYIAGITTNSALTGTPAAVYVDANGQLGVQVSSERFKRDIEDMGGASAGLMQLRPVTYRYKNAASDAGNPLQFGLIAEEVAKIYPDMVVRDAKGEIEGVAYQELPALLLNEVQKQHGQIQVQLQTIQSLEERIARLEGLLQGRSQAERKRAHR